jgi:hypothetical protein
VISWPTRFKILKAASRNSRPYLIADVRALSAKYIFVGEIAFRRGLHPRLAVAWLNSIDVKAAFSLRKKQDLVFLRKDVEPSLGLRKVSTTAISTHKQSIHSKPC